MEAQLTAETHQAIEPLHLKGLTDPRVALKPTTAMVLERDHKIQYLFAIFMRLSLSHFHCVVPLLTWSL